MRTQAGVFQLIWQLPGLFSSRNRLRWPFVCGKLGRLLLPEVLILFFFASLCLPAAWRWPAVAGQALFYGLALVEPWIGETNPLKSAVAPIRAFVVLASAALFAVRIFWVQPEKLWKQTKVRAPILRQTPSKMDDPT